jgi:glycosyltransferase involved in cell wall biosynthesis
LQRFPTFATSLLRLAWRGRSRRSFRVGDAAEVGQSAAMVLGLVSIIMPNRNHAQFLPRAIEALLGQTYPDLELLVVDDSSSDNSREVVRRYAGKDPRVRLLELTDHHGINRAVSAALPKVSGEYVYFAAADDVVAPAFLKRMVAQLAHHRSAGLCFSDPTERNEATGRVEAFPLYLSEAPVFYDADALALTLHHSYFHISSNTAVYRTASIRAAGGYRKDLDWLSDWFVTSVVALRHGACYVPEQLTYLTVRADSYSATNLRNAAVQHQLIEKVLNLLLQPEFHDVAQRVRSAGLLPEYHMRTLFWLAGSRAGWRFLTPHVVARVLMRALWSNFRPFASVRLRRALRRRASARGLVRHRSRPH